jgi:hypothetical protein
LAEEGMGLFKGKPRLEGSIGALRSGISNGDEKVSIPGFGDN